jgi:Tol biopolymer transport system component
MKNIISILMTLLLFSTSCLYAQFGQNKVQYKEYDWYFIQTKHFDIYFSSESNDIAEFTAKIAEEALESIQDKLKFKINNRISLIVYNSHNDFQETNTTAGYLSQGIGGFTEPFKNRVVFPFEGSYRKFRHVIHHELVHAVIRDMLYGGTVQNIITKGITLQLPLWYHEGMAEYLSSIWETNSDMFIRDAIINEYLPDIERLNGYFAIAKKYGEEKVGEILSKIRGLGSLEEGIKSSIGLNIEELNTRWKKDLKKQYWPEIATSEDPDEFAKRLTNNKKVRGFYNTSPAISPQGDKIVFISDRDIYLDVYVMNIFDEEDVQKVISSGKETDFEELNVLYPTLTWAPDNRRIALSGKSEGYDVINIIDIIEGDNEELPFKFGGIESVSWSSDGDKLAFVASTASQSDIYTYQFSTGELENVTNDIFSDADPSWTPNGKNIIFASDRDSYIEKMHFNSELSMKEHDFSHLDLYNIDVETKEMVRLTNWKLSDEKSPVVSPNGKMILFVSDYNGIDNIYRKRISLTEEDTVSSVLELAAYPLTNSLNGINQLSISSDGKKLVFTSLFNSGYNIFLLNNPFEIEVLENPLEMTKYMAELYNSKEKQLISAESDLSVLGGKLNSQTQLTNIYVEETDTSETNTDIFTGQYVGEDSNVEELNENDYSSYVFGQDDIITDSTDNQLKREEIFKENLDYNGDYLVNKYKISFSPDLIYANAGYSTFYGLLGTTVLSFSDVLGNHRLIGITSLQIDLKNSDYGLAYYYLPKRIDYGIEAFHTARFVFLTRGNQSDLFRFRNFGGVLSASLPLNRFYRLSASLSMLNVSSENLDNLNEPTDNTTFLIPSLSFVHDNILWGYTSPIEGSRYRLTVFGNPGLGNSRQSFYSLVWDYRRYFRFLFDNLFVFRVSGGFSGGANPQRFFLGGTESWINRKFASGDIPLNSAADFAFLTPALPLRGYDYAERIGTKYSLLNLELRMPLIRYLLTGPLPLFFQNILGVAFLDAGAAWDKTDKLQLIGKNENGTTVTKDLLLGMGYGFRAYFIFLWRFDIAWSYDLRHFSRPKYYLSLGLDF